ncbi:hypothetical protein SAMN05216343_10378 [Oscillibacter sp. PC13]|uniref:hypothetical protein n=1 Tax=Oscillibacter sp. PC13 TaxID=1855299 RepID=UPI0008ED73C8|nr:hypothetical protein [Oscillibacter sp. PC13]SFP11052.1 hypothetical protein SAMN05216343_10378 [Oscillibacter sp. PC13]
MEAAIFDCPADWEKLLPKGIRILKSRDMLADGNWSLLALTEQGCRQIVDASCRVLLVPGDWAASVLTRVRADTVITCGLSPRDSLTLSSLTEPVLCVQRALPRPDGGEVVPQEFPLPPLPGNAVQLLPLLGLRLLQMPLTETPFLW